MRTSAHLLKPASYWIEKLQMQPHPEGGYYAETYRSSETVQGQHLPGRYGASRSFATAIYFLVEGGTFSAMHRIKSDELWHYYAGSRISVYVIEPEGNLQIIHLGSNPEAEEVFQAVVKRGCWFGSMVEEAGSYALVGCTVAPGFDFADFELANRQELLRLYPQHCQVIEALMHTN
jgi:predicted cupin superfamily sugar epimerase